MRFRTVLKRSPNALIALPATARSSRSALPSSCTARPSDDLTGRIDAIAHCGPRKVEREFRILQPVIASAGIKQK